MVEIDYEPFLADKKFNKTSPPAFLTLIEAHKTVYQEVFKHFSAEDFVIPDFEDGDGKLTEEERYYLVSSLFIRPAVCLGTENLSRFQSYECFLRLVIWERLKPRVLTLSWPSSLDSLGPQSGMQPTASRGSKPLSNGDASTESTIPSRLSPSKNTCVIYAYVAACV